MTAHELKSKKNNRKYQHVRAVILRKRWRESSLPGVVPLVPGKSARARAGNAVVARPIFYTNRPRSDDKQ